jgi:hypothetical protein
MIRPWVYLGRSLPGRGLNPGVLGSGGIILKIRNRGLTTRIIDSGWGQPFTYDTIFSGLGDIVPGCPRECSRLTSRMKGMMGKGQMMSGGSVRLSPDSTQGYLDNSLLDLRPVSHGTRVFLPRRVIAIARAI